MKRHRKISLFVSILLIFAGIATFFCCYNGDKKKESFDVKTSKKEKQFLAGMAKIAQVCGQKVQFHGIVLDQFDIPVFGATIEYSLMDPANFFRAFGGKNPKRRFEKTDENGRFSISGIGGSLSCFVSHPDYYRTDRSTHLRGEAQREKNLSHDDRENPIVFRLYKKGGCEPLYYSCSDVIGKGSSWIRIPEEGIEINLANGKAQKSTTSIRIFRKNNRVRKDDICCDWEYVLQIPRGGFRERQGDFKFSPGRGSGTGYLKHGDDFSFLAPEDGYREEVRIGYKEGEEDWKSRKTCRYFIRFSNGLYGIFEIVASSSGSIRFQALINPNPASRNLEYDYQKQINKNQRNDGYWCSL